MFRGSEGPNLVFALCLIASLMSGFMDGPMDSYRVVTPGQTNRSDSPALLLKPCAAFRLWPWWA
jgi:hypothetical protein